MPRMRRSSRSEEANALLAAAQKENARVERALQAVVADGILDDAHRLGPACVEAQEESERPREEYERGWQKLTEPAEDPTRFSVRPPKQRRTALDRME